MFFKGGLRKSAERGQQLLGKFNTPGVLADIIGQQIAALCSEFNGCACAKLGSSNPTCGLPLAAVRAK